MKNLGAKIREERKLENVYRSLFSKSYMNKKIGTELDILPTDQFNKYKEAFPGYEFFNLSSIILEQRKRKDARNCQNQKGLRSNSYGP